MNSNANFWIHWVFAKWYNVDGVVPHIFLFTKFMPHRCGSAIFEMCDNLAL